MSGHSKSFGQTKSSSIDTEPKVYIKPRIITVLRSGTRPRKAVRVLLNNRCQLILTYYKLNLLLLFQCRMGTSFQ